MRSNELLLTFVNYVCLFITDNKIKNRQQPVRERISRFLPFDRIWKVNFQMNLFYENTVVGVSIACEKKIAYKYFHRHDFLYKWTTFNMRLDL